MANLAPTQIDLTFLDEGFSHRQLATMNCSACGLPPLPHQRLKQCTRCKSVWYHDIECQKQHYPEHKAECRRLSAANSVAPASSARASMNRNESKTSTRCTDVVTFNDADGEENVNIEYTHPLSQCKMFDGKGRSLIAMSDMYIGAHPLNPSSEDVDTAGWCEPLVPPVLMDEQRQSRCSYCFNRLDEEFVSQPKEQLHYHCSQRCREKDKNCAMEENAVRLIRIMIPNIDLPPPTVLLAARIMRYSAKSELIERKFEELCYNIDDLCEKEKSQYHKVITNCNSLLRFIDPHGEACKRAQEMMDNSTEAYKFISRIMINGFTISTLEQEGIGLGVYPGASMINHSCRPNAVQSFYFFPSEYQRQEMETNVPMLQVTTCQKVEAGEEITISYCDNSAPRHMRRRELLEGYKFLCDCSWCEEINEDMSVVGLECADSNCRGKIVRLHVDDSALIEDPRYECSVCGFAQHADTLAELTLNIKTVEKSMKHESYGNDINIVDNAGYSLNKTYGLLRNICSIKKSWYIAWCADAFVNWSIDALSYSDDQRRSENICIQALRMIDQSRSAIRLCYKYPGGLKWYAMMGTEAKLRLLLNYEDMEAYNLLWDARRYLSLFAPDQDDIIKSLDDSIMNYSGMAGFDGSDPLFLDYCHLPEDVVRTLWKVNGCQEYSADTDKDNFFKGS